MLRWASQQPHGLPFGLKDSYLKYITALIKLLMTGYFSSFKDSDGERRFYNNWGLSGVHNPRLYDLKILNLLNKKYDEVGNVTRTST
jgi:hypothetical protein